MAQGGRQRMVTVLAAVSELVVDDMLEGRADDKRTVRRVRIKLHSKQEAIQELNRMFGWIVSKS